VAAARCAAKRPAKADFVAAADVDDRALEDRVYREAIESGHGRLLGASTISMQTAKNVFLWPGRDWLRKGFEAWFTALIELAWGKRRIMEIYLNVAEWGPGLYGAEAAARYYFHKGAHALDLGEAIRLAAALPDPLEWSPRRPGRRLLARSAAIRANIQSVHVALPLPCGAGGPPD
jgi:monofunctional biosynthetic peptidoglycan transglycosylase